MPNPGTNHFRHALPATIANSNAIHCLLHSYPAAQANSEHSATHFSAVCNTAQASVSLYPKAYERWKQLWQTAQENKTASLIVQAHILIIIKQHQLQPYLRHPRHTRQRLQRPRPALCRQPPGHRRRSLEWPV